MISRTCFASFHARLIRSRRLGPIPSTCCNSGASIFDDAQHVGSELLNQLLRQNRADALDQAAAEVSLDPFDRGWRHGFQGAGFELQSVFLVPDPPAVRNRPFPCGHGRQRPDDRDFFPLAFDFYAQYAKPALVAVERDALDQPGNLFRCRLAFRGCGIHAWDHFPMFTASSASDLFSEDIHQDGKQRSASIGSCCQAALASAEYPRT